MGPSFCGFSIFFPGYWALSWRMRFSGKYKTIITLSLVYCAGHACLAFMGVMGDTKVWLFGGLILIAIGSGGIKPCVSAHVGDQFGKSNGHLFTKLFGWFYFSINLGAFASQIMTIFTGGDAGCGHGGESVSLCKMDGGRGRLG